MQSSPVIKCLLIYHHLNRADQIILFVLRTGHSPMNVRVSLLLYETYANVSSRLDENLSVRSQFHSNDRVNLYTPRYCQSATCGPLAFCVCSLLYYGKTILMSPRPPRARYAHRAHRSVASYMLNCIQQKAVRAVAEW